MLAAALSGANLQDAGSKGGVQDPGLPADSWGYRPTKYYHAKTTTTHCYFSCISYGDVEDDYNDKCDGDDYYHDDYGYGVKGG
eukprot:3488502-Pyramimonas_sp.AAC.1